MEKPCPICTTPCELTSFPGGISMYTVDCRLCGKYTIPQETSSAEIEQYGKRHLLSGAIRNHYEDGTTLELTTERLETLLDSVSIPSDPMESINHLIQYLGRRTLPGRVLYFLHKTSYPILYGLEPYDFTYCMENAIKLQFIEHMGDQKYRLTIKGWQKAEELKKKEIKSNQAFVAMWFDPNMNMKIAWEEGIKSALEECGYIPLRIDAQEHNDKICDRIIAEIRASGLTIADFTGQRGGVYFEAGFAMGLGIPVIWTCRKDQVKELHFDTRQYNHIVWTTPQELKEKLINRIKATIPGRHHIQTESTEAD